MFAYPSVEWYQELANLLNNSPEYGKAAANSQGRFCFAVQADPGKLENDIFIFMKIASGKVESVSHLANVNPEELDFILTAPYSVWKEIVLGKLDSNIAMMKGRLKVQGDMGKLLRQSKANAIMNTFLKKIPTKFTDEA